ncbi:MAG TPA: class I SAM-dependent methyltransferase [Spirochaetota bacterium]|nr:class I SAM-dependent methyltransferase [Spirochaetota bacterium]HNT11830.1 class I SAM-dependent methyltransferase [Spirochaetota bacterium]
MRDERAATDLLGRALDRRADLHADSRTTCYRIFNGGGDGIDGLCVDRYGEYLLVQLYEPSLYDAIDVIRASLETIAARTPFPVAGVLAKDRTLVRETVEIAERRRSVLLLGERPPEDYVVLQNGLRAAVDLLHGQNTGVFLDMREVRDALAQVYAETHDLINLFCYTGLFSVHALAHGVSRAVNVDLSRPFLRRARRNYALNGLPVDDRDFICGDSFEWSRRFSRQERRFDLVVFDPPTFSRNKRKTFSVKRNYRQALAALDMIAGRYALTAVNSQTVCEDEYRAFHPTGWKCLFVRHEPPDFRLDGAPYLKAGLWHTR